MKNKIFLIIGIITILIVGLSFVTAQNKWHGFKKNGYHKDWTGHKNFDKSAWLEKMGLPADATDDEIIAAKKVHYTKEFDMSAWLEKMGLPADATEDEIAEFKEAQWEDKTAWKKEGFHSKRGSRYKGTWCNS